MLKSCAVFCFIPLVAFAQEYESVEITPDSDMFNSDAVGEFINVPVSAPGGQTELPVFVGEDGLAVFQGDIIFGDAESLLSTPNPVPFGVSSSDPEGLWPNATMRYLRVDDPKIMSAVKKAITAWNKTGVVKFEEISNPIGDYVEFVYVRGVCRSWLGRQGGRQTIEIGSGCGAAEVAHEIAHAFGLMHEQVRSDRDKYVIYHEENVKNPYQLNFRKDASLYTDLGVYCYNSLMHYGEQEFAKPGTKTLEIRISGLSLPHEGSSIGQRQRISSCDIKAMHELYN